MSSYRGAWDGGPPGAEAEYGPPPPPPASALPASALPATDPWTGVSYTHYAPQGYDYQAYGASYGYNYDPNYYQRPDSAYYGKFPDSRPPPPGYPPASQPPGFDYPPETQERTRSPVESRSYDHRKSYRSKSRSGSPYKRENAFSKRDSSYEEPGRHHRSRSRSIKSKRTKYSSSDRSSSRSPSYSRSLVREDKRKKRSLSTDSSVSSRSYKKHRNRSQNRSITPKRRIKLERSHSITRSRTPSIERSPSKSPRLTRDAQAKKSHSKKELKIKDKMHSRDVSSPHRKYSEGTPPKCSKVKIERSSVTPPKSYKRSRKSPSTKSSKYKNSLGTPPRKAREKSLTPPKSYARSRSSSSSKSPSRSPTPRREKRITSRTSKSRHSRSISRSSSKSSRSSTSTRSKSKRKNKRMQPAKRMSRSKSRSKRSVSRSKSRRRSKSRGRRSGQDSKSRSRSRTPRSRSPSRTPSDDEQRRGQFTVADRKRFWKLRRQEEMGKEKTPPKEVKPPPPGAIEPTHVDDIEYGDPPEVEGPNYAELLTPVDQVLPGCSSSKSKNLPIPIKNDGSFLEMFKKMQELTKVEEKKPEIKKPVLPFIGKRRGGRVLKTGLVKKAKAIDEQTVDSAPKDAWSLYMQEVKKYRETSCEEERKTRPLVK